MEIPIVKQDEEGMIEFSQFLKIMELSMKYSNKKFAPTKKANISKRRAILKDVVDADQRDMVYSQIVS